MRVLIARLRLATGMRRIVLWAVPALLVACAVAIQSNLDDSGAPRSPEPPRPTVNHKLHFDRDVLCTDCHDPKETGTPVLPDSKACFECHEKDLSKEPDRVRAYFDAVKQPDGTFRFSRPAYMADLIAPHKEHAKYGVECVSCHGPPLERAFPRPAPLAFMASCMECHEAKGKPERNTCETCHKETRKELSPASHKDAAFRALHGKSAPAGWREGRGESCAICHSVPQDCTTCHQKTKPLSHTQPGFLSYHGKQAPKGWREGKGEECATCHEVPNDCSACHQSTTPVSHREAGWNRFHGKGELLGRERSFEDVSCSLCHQERACSACHQTEKPRTHTPAWERRYHGIQVDLDRQSCTTCHKQDFCTSCHETTEPVSHRGNWDDAHCLNCHEPLQSNSCFACHKNTLGHLTATPRPPDATHGGASDPADCLTCHTVLPHFDSGGRCGTCHR
jgi:hypothetical protein